VHSINKVQIAEKLRGTTSQCCGGTSWTCTHCLHTSCQVQLGWLQDIAENLLDFSFALTLIYLVYFLSI